MSQNHASLFARPARSAAAIVLVLGAMAAPALAHTGVGAVNSFSAGVTHPLFGLDHLLAMVAVGLWAMLAEPRLFWVAPAGFLAGMLAGGIAGMSGVAAPGIEFAIVGSVIAFGALAFFKVKTPALIAFVIAAFFGAAHGLAHGAEMPAGGAALQYGLGFLLATAALHAIGASLGLVMQRLDLVRLGQATGGALAAAGVVLMLGM